MQLIFWLSLGSILYCYLGYPLGLWLLSKKFSRPVHKAPQAPSVSVVMSVWNEEDVIDLKIRNLHSIIYPEEKIEFLIGSDGSTDRTNEIVRAYENDRLRLIESPDRRGKMRMLNELVAQAKGEVVVFMDARQVFAKKAVQHLVNNFADSQVGCVSGELEFSEKDTSTAKGINLYWNYEKSIRRLESQIHSMLGATGAIYAIRKELFTPIPEDIVLDDVFVPLNIVLKGYRAVFDMMAQAYDEVAISPKEEYKRKVRTLFGNYQLFMRMPGLFNPFKCPVALQLFSHKLLRLMVPFLMAACFMTNVFLFGPFYQAFFALQGTFYAMAFAGAFTRYKKRGMLRAVSKVCYAPYIFCLMNFSALIGFWRFIRGGQDVAWEKARVINESTGSL